MLETVGPNAGTDVSAELGCRDDVGPDDGCELGEEYKFIISILTLDSRRCQHSLTHETLRT